MRPTSALAAGLALTVLAGTLPAGEPLGVASSWPLWDSYTAYFLDGSGRIVDHDANDRTTSEGQAYALFFSLVANDRAKFDRILAWTHSNLSRGDLSANLPGWLWGNQQGSWKLIDQNPAADADLWMAYTLLEAGRHWHDSKLNELGKGLAASIMQREVADIPGFGPMLLPGPSGFKTSDGWYELNASYLPVQLLLGVANRTGDARWKQIADLVPKVVEGSSAKGFVLDWTAYRPDEGFSVQPSPVSPLLGSYDAIRVYLWAGMLAQGTAGRAQMLGALPAMANYLDREQAPPTSVSEAGQVTDARGNVGFSAAVIPLLTALNRTQPAERQRERLRAQKNDRTGLYGNNPRYYDQNLALFALGWCENRFHFDERGLLRVNWK